jgi:hypothetical protein
LIRCDGDPDATRWHLAEAIPMRRVGTGQRRY